MAGLTEHLSEHVISSWKHAAEGSRFYGLSISEFSRDELLAVIGWLIEDKDRAFKRHTEEREALFKHPIF